MNIFTSTYFIIITVLSIRNVATDISTFSTWDNLKIFLLPPLSTIFYLPFIYLLALYIAYESLFNRMKSFDTDKKLLRYAKIKILMKFNLNLRHLKKWIEEGGIRWFDSKEDLDEMLKENA